METLLPVSNRLAILVNGRIYDIDQLDKLVERHSEKGYTVVVQLKYKTNVTKIFVRYFTKFIINDSSEVCKAYSLKMKIICICIFTGVLSPIFRKLCTNCLLFPQTKLFR